MPSRLSCFQNLQMLKLNARPLLSSSSELTMSSFWCHWDGWAQGGALTTCQDPNRVPSSAFPHSVSLRCLAERVRLAPQAWQRWALTQPWCAQISRTSWGLRWATPPPWMSSSVLWTTFCVCRWVGAGRWHASCTLLEAKDSYRRPGTTEDTVQPECRRCCKPCAHTHGKSNT